MARPPAVRNLVATAAGKCRVVFDHSHIYYDLHLIDNERVILLGITARDLADVPLCWRLQWSPLANSSEKSPPNVVGALHASPTM
jgi:hypothetical protein